MGNADDVHTALLAQIVQHLLQPAPFVVYLDVPLAEPEIFNVFLLTLFTNTLPHQRLCPIEAVQNESFEVLIANMANDFGCGYIRKKVCECKGTDKVAEICFQCHNSDLDENEFLTGIHSYIKRIRTDASHVTAVI